MSILVVEGDAAMRHSLAFALETDGLDVIAVAGACELPPEEPRSCRCLVLDQSGAGEDGVDTLYRLRARGWRAPALMLVSHVAVSAHQRARAAGARLIEKPLIDDAFLTAVRQTLERGALS